MILDRSARAFYELHFENRFLRSRGEGFQDFFASVMEKAHPRDFQRTRPWGSAGDRKNDGYLKGARTLFQVYAPNELTAADAVAKIEADFAGAVHHWREHFDTWVFVHNAWDGLGPQVLAKLLEIAAANPSIRVEHWGLEALRRIVLGLSEPDLVCLFGHAPSQRGFIALQMAELLPVFEQISRLTPERSPDLRPVSPAKLTTNLLSEHVATLLRAGMARERLVRDYFRARMDPRRRDEVAEAFRRRYAELRAEGRTPDDIFVALQRWIGGSDIGAAHHQEAVFAVLAYMFQECEIFERPSEDAP